MNKITIITGQQGTGKTTLALELVKEKLFYCTVENEFARALKYMAKETEVIIVDDVFSLTVLKKICTVQAVHMRRPYEKKVSFIKVPDLIITTSLPKDTFKDSRMPNVRFIHLKEILK